MSQKDQTLPYGQKTAADEPKPTAPPAKTIVQQHGVAKPAQVSPGDGRGFVSTSEASSDATLAPVGSGSFAEA